jgi:hypothetical protein
MKIPDNKHTKNNKIRFFQNVCSTRTDLGLIQNLKKQDLCKRGMNYHD